MSDPSDRQPPRSPATRRDEEPSRVVTWGGALAVVCVALWARVSVLPEVFVAGRVLTRDPDAHYHLRRIAQTVEAFPRVPLVDPLLNWPDGAVSPWAPGFDWLAALFTRVFANGPDDRVAAWFPVALGILLVVGTMVLADRLAPRSASRTGTVLVAGLLAALLPRLVMSSQLGRVDHHVFEALSMLALGLWVTTAAAESDAQPRREGAWWRFEAVGAGIAFLAGFGFAGATLYVAIAAALLMGLHATAAARGPGRQRLLGIAGSGAPALWLAGLALLWVNRAYVGAHGDAWSFRSPSLLQPVLYFVAGGGCLVASFVASFTEHRWRDERSVSVRVSERVGIIALCGLAGLAVVGPWLGGPVWTGLVEWVAHRDPWLASIEEFKPVFVSWALWRPENAVALYHFNALPGLLAPLVIPLGLGLAIRNHRRVGVCFAVWTAALVVLTLIQNRFGQVLSVNYALCLALVGVAAAEALERRLAMNTRDAKDDGPANGSTFPSRVPLIVAGLVALVLLPDPAVRSGLTWRASRELTALEAVSLELADRPPGAAGPGVVARWSHGHALLRLAGRPVLAAGFGHWTGEEAFEATQHFMYGTEQSLLSLMDARRASWVVTGMHEAFPAADDSPSEAGKPFRWARERQRVEPSPGFFRRFPLTPLILGGGGLPSLEVHHVEHLMPQYASPDAARGLGFPLQRLWLFERVAGAVLEGEAEPGARVVARTQMQVHGRAIPYVAWTRSDAAGHFRLVLPLPTGIERPDFATAPAYVLEIADSEAGRLAISEAQVRAGEHIAWSRTRGTPLADTRR